MNAPLLGGRYAILEQIGGGGWATVHKATDTLLGRTVAVKILRSQYAADPEFVSRFRQEAHAAASLSHPHVVSIFDVGEDDGTHYIVMEYVDGITLRGLIDHEGRLEPVLAAKLGAQLLDALDHAHQSGIVHRDITPRNIMITRSGRVKVTDFGIARAANAAGITQSRSILGSAPYLSPEQARGGSTSFASDLYSAGIVLYEMVTGAVPFTAESPVAIALMHIEQQPRPPHELVPDIPPGLEQVILTAMHKDEVRRYPRAGAMRQALAEFVRGAGGGDPEEIEEAQALPGLAALPIGTGAFAGEGGDATQTLVRETPKPQEKPKRRMRPSPAFWVGIVSMLLLAGAVYWAVEAVKEWLVVPDAIVPNLVGEPQTRAQELLREQGLILEVGKQIASEKPFGEVLSQEPEANMVIKSGRTVTVTISAGPRTVTMPDFRGASLSEVQRFLSENGLNEGHIRYEHDPTKPMDTVLETHPKHGETAVFNQYVDIVVSTGKAELAMPDVVGNPGEAAANHLKALGFVVDVQEADEPDKESGVVLEQHPVAGTKVVEGDRIVLRVNKEQQQFHTVTVTVPGDLPSPVHVRVELYEGDGITIPMHDGFHAPGQTITVELQPQSPGARYGVLINGSIVESGVLP